MVELCRLSELHPIDTGHRARRWQIDAQPSGVAPLGGQKSVGRQSEVMEMEGVVSAAIAIHTDFERELPLEPEVILVPPDVAVNHQQVIASRRPDLAPAAKPIDESLRSRVMDIGLEGPGIASQSKSVKKRGPFVGRHGQ